jgi:NDP-mannose synthase
MHAVILAGGKGVRLHPYTTVLPKPLVPIGGRYTILEIILNQLAAHGFLSVTLAINHLGDLIRAFVGDGSRWGMTIEYVQEDVPLSTVGPLFGLRDRLPERFLVMNGDVLTDLDYGDLMHGHELSGAALTVATADRSVKIDFGVLTTDGPRLIAFTEKPTYHYRVSMGVYAMSRCVLAAYPAGLPLGFDQLMLDLLDREEYPASYPFDGIWVDVGRPEDYDQVNRDFAELAPILMPAWDGAVV